MIGLRQLVANGHNTSHMTSDLTIDVSHSAAIQWLQYRSYSGYDIDGIVVTISVA